jgi:hypothetical protein
VDILVHLDQAFLNPGDEFADFHGTLLGMGHARPLPRHGNIHPQRLPRKTQPIAPQPVLAQALSRWMG